MSECHSEKRVPQVGDVWRLDSSNLLRDVRRVDGDDVWLGFLGSSGEGWAWPLEVLHKDFEFVRAATPEAKPEAPRMAKVGETWIHGVHTLTFERVGGISCGTHPAVIMLGATMGGVWCPACLTAQGWTRVEASDQAPAPTQDDDQADAFRYAFYGLNFVASPKYNIRVDLGRSDPPTTNLRQPYCAANMATEAMIRELTDRHDMERAIEPLSAWEEATTPVFVPGSIAAFVQDHRVMRKGPWV